MTDQRPRYGELATPEEQRRAAGLPPLDQVVIDAVPAGAHPVVAPAVGHPARGERVPTDEVPARRHPVDRLVTIALLAYGLVNVVITAISYLDLTAVMNQAMSVLGIEGEFTNYAQGRLWGTIAAVVLVVGWVLTAVLAVRRLRQGRIAWWIPVVGALVTGAIVSMCLAVPMMGDPAFVAFLDATR